MQTLVKTPMGIFPVHVGYEKLKEAGLLGQSGVFDRLEVQIENYIPHPEKHGYLKYIGNKTVGEVRKRLEEYLPHYVKPIEGAENWKDRFDYFDLSAATVITGLKSDSPWPRCHGIACFVVKGANEGYYLHVEALKQEGTRQLVFLGKTFLGASTAWEVAEAIATILQA